MSSPYRESAASSVQCPRCGTDTAGGDISACLDGCGVWVTPEAAGTAFEPSELHASRLTSWFRQRCACPSCGKTMTLRGHDMSLFQGCDAHGFWVDDSTITQTGLGRLAIAPRVTQARAAAKARREALARIAAEGRERMQAEEHEAATRREDAARAVAEAKEARERALREAKRHALTTKVRAALASGEVGPLVDELIRLDDAITQLAHRVTNTERY